MIRILAGCFGLLIVGAAHAQIVQCVDAKGNKEYAHNCRPGTVKETQITKGGSTAPAAPTAATGTTATDPAKPAAGPAAGKTASPAAAPAGPKTIAERDAEFRKRAMERQEAEAKSAKEQAAAKDAAENCISSQAQLKALKEGQRMSKINPATGERIVLDDASRPAEIASAQKAVDSWCSKPKG